MELASVDGCAAGDGVAGVAAVVAVERLGAWGAGDDGAALDGVDALEDEAVDEEGLG